MNILSCKVISNNNYNKNSNNNYNNSSNNYIIIIIIEIGRIAFIFPVNIICTGIYLLMLAFS